MMPQQLGNGWGPSASRGSSISRGMRSAKRQDEPFCPRRSYNLNGVRCRFERPEMEQQDSAVHRGCGVDFAVSSNWRTVPQEYAHKGTPTQTEAITQDMRGEEWGGHHFTRPDTAIPPELQFTLIVREEKEDRPSRKKGEANSGAKYTAWQTTRCGTCSGQMTKPVQRTPRRARKGPRKTIWMIISMKTGQRRRELASGRRQTMTATTVGMPTPTIAPITAPGEYQQPAHGMQISL